MLKFQFLVAEVNDEIVRQSVEPVLKILQRFGDVKRINHFEKQRKSVAHRFEFTMEVVFRAADRALSSLMDEPNIDKIAKLVEKLDAMAKFLLDTLQLVMNIAIELEDIMPEVEISGLEYIISEKLTARTKEDKPVLIYTCARWMNDEQYIRPWVTKHGGMWGRMMFNSWQNTYKEQRTAVMERLTSMYLSV